MTLWTPEPGPSYSDTDRAALSQALTVMLGPHSSVAVTVNDAGRLAIRVATDQDPVSVTAAVEQRLASLHPTVTVESSAEH